MLRSHARKNEKSTKESDSDTESQREADYALQLICLNEAIVILLEPIIIDKNYLEKDIVAVLGNLVVELTEFTLFEYNTRIPMEGDCIINQSFHTNLGEELGRRINHGNFGIFLKFHCSTKNTRKLKKYIKIGSNIIKLIKEFINMQSVSSSSNLLDEFILQLKKYQKF